MKAHRIVLLAAGTIGLVNGCAPLFLAGAGTAAIAAHDRRSLGASIDDEAIELKAGSALRSDDELRRDTHINITSMNGVVLLGGEAATAELRDRVLARTREVTGIRRIVNEVRVASVASLGNRGHDVWLTTKVKTKLIRTEDLDSTRVKVVTENDAVYLMGLVTQREGGLATEVARSVQGTARVVKLFEYVD